MSSIGRIFVILNLILAAAFLGWASTMLSKGNEWKQQYEEVQQDLAAANTAHEEELSQMRLTLDEERNEKDANRTARDNAEGDLARVKQELKDAVEANAGLRASITKIEATLGDYNQTIAAMNSAKDAAITEARDLERERDTANDERAAAQQAQRDAEEALANASKRIADLEIALTSSSKDVAQLEAKLSQAVALAGIDLDAISAAPPIEARVLQVNNDLKPGLVALNVGSNQGVQRGFTFQIFRGNVWKGQVRIESVQPGMSSALITNMKPGETIAQGDNASTIL